MKKALLLVTVILVASLGMSARDYTTSDIGVLPQKARAFIKNNFKNPIDHIDVDDEAGGKTDYEVYLNDGTEIEFDHSGLWKNIDCGTSAIPASVVPKTISSYLKTNYKGQKIVEIEMKKRGCEIKLSNGVELEFDKNGRFKKVDN